VSSDVSNPSNYASLVKTHIVKELQTPSRRKHFFKSIKQASSLSDVITLYYALHLYCSLKEIDSSMRIESEEKAKSEYLIKLIEKIIENSKTLMIELFKIVNIMSFEIGRIDLSNMLIESAFHIVSSSGNVYTSYICSVLNVIDEAIGAVYIEKFKNIGFKSFSPKKILGYYVYPKTFKNGVYLTGIHVIPNFINGNTEAGSELKFSTVELNTHRKYSIKESSIYNIKKRTHLAETVSRRITEALELDQDEAEIVRYMLKRYSIYQTPYVLLEDLISDSRLKIKSVREEVVKSLIEKNVLYYFKDKGGKIKVGITNRILEYLILALCEKDLCDSRDRARLERIRDSR